MHRGPWTEPLLSSHIAAMLRSPPCCNPYPGSSLPLALCIAQQERQCHNLVGPEKLLCVSSLQTALRCPLERIDRRMLACFLVLVWASRQKELLLPSPCVCCHLRAPHHVYSVTSYRVCHPLSGRCRHLMLLRHCHIAHSHVDVPGCNGICSSQRRETGKDAW